MLLEREKILAFFKRFGDRVIKNEKRRYRLQKYLAQINKVLFTFIAGKGLNSIINVFIVTTMLFILGVPYYFLLGLLAGLLNFIPYLGSLIAVTLITIISLLTGGLAFGLRVVIPLFIFQQMDGNYIEPRIMKTALKISPILVITSVLVGGAYFGIWGMFFAVPIATMIKQILLEYTNPTVTPEATPDTDAPADIGTATDVDTPADTGTPTDVEAPADTE
jgi:predicted PurR-regulated permease PerM